MKKYIKPMMKATEVKMEGMLCTSGKDEGTFDFDGYGDPI